MNNNTKVNANNFKVGQEVLQDLLVKADANGIEIDPIDIECSIKALADSTGNTEHDGLVANSLYRVGQAVGLVASPVTCVAGLVLPESFKAGFRSGNGMATRAYRSAINTASEKASAIADKYATKLRTRKTTQEEAPVVDQMAGANA